MTPEEKARLRAQLIHLSDGEIDRYEMTRKIIEDTLKPFAGNPQIIDISDVIIQMVIKHFNLKPV